MTCEDCSHYDELNNFCWKHLQDDMESTDTCDDHERECHHQEEEEYV